MDLKTFKETSESPEKLVAYFNTLEDRIAALELEAEARPEPEPKVKLKTAEELAKSEHDSIEDDPEPHIAQRMEYGLPRDKAVLAVEQRKGLLKTELGIRPKVRTAVKKSAATALIILAAMLGLFTPARAVDYQGYPATLGTLTNTPSAAGTNAFPASNMCLTNGAAVGWSNNIIPLRTKSGLSIQAAFALALSNSTAGSLDFYFYPTSDGSNYWNNYWAKWSPAPNGTNLTIVGTNWTELQLRGWLAMAVTVSNNCGTNWVELSGTITNGQSTFIPGTNTFGVATNAGQVNPLGISWNRPNIP